MTASLIPLPDDAVQPAGQGQESDNAPAVQPEGQGQQGADTPDVQPEGQGVDGVTETGLYDLSTVPEEQREFIAPILKDIERNANARFQQHADHRATWAPYEELGVNELDPEGLGALLEFAQQLDGEGARDAILGLAENLGIDLTGDAAVEGEPDPIAELRAEVQELREWKEARVSGEQLEAEQATAAESIQAEWAEVQKAHGRPFTDKEVERLRKLATEYLKADNPEPIKAAYSFIKELAGEAATEFVGGSPDVPATAAPGGRASTTAEPTDDFKEAQRLHAERRQQRTATAA